MLFLNINLNLEKTLCGGQAFRYNKISENSYEGVFGGRFFTVCEHQNGIIIDCNESDNCFFEDYFDINTDYDFIRKNLEKNAVLKTFLDKTQREIRILKQDPFETLISFIISQNNNIKRIKGIIERFCENFGEVIPCLEKDFIRYDFPKLENLIHITESDLEPLRAGFRSKYIIDAIKKIASGDVNLEEIKTLDNNAANDALQKIKGVGKKVADCVLLFGYNRLNVFPRDVHIKRLEAKYFPNGLPECIKGYEGIAQQYLFENRG